MMKKIISFALVLIMILSFSAAFAEVNLSELSYEELLTLQKKLTDEIISRPEWKSVEVPAGHWRVGEDIPSGSYCIRVPDTNNLYIRIWGKDYEDWDSNGGLLYHEPLTKGSKIGKIKLEDGWLVDIDNIAIFEPPVGLGF